MTVKRVESGFLISLPNSFKMEQIQVLLDYFKAMEIVAQNKGTTEQAAALAEEVDANWWKQNKQRFLLGIG